MDLKYSYDCAHISHNELRHAQKVLKELGIKYKNSLGQSARNEFWFYDCENIPTKLPEYITEL